MGKYSSLGKNTILIFVGSLGTKLLTVLMLPFYTAWLSVNDFGNVDMISTYSSLIMSIVTLCMTDAIFRFPKGKRKEEQIEYFTSGLTVVIISLIVTGILYFLILKMEMTVTWGVFKDYASYIYILLFLNFLQLYFQQFCRSIDRMKIYVISGIILTSVTAGLSIILIPRYGLDGYLYSQFVGAISSLLYIGFKIKILDYFSLSYYRIRVVKEMLSYSIPMIPNATLWWILGASNRLIIENNSGVYDVGIFAVANRFPSMITMFFNSFFLSWQISVLEEYGTDNFSTFFNRIFRASFLVLFGIVICLSIFSYIIIIIFVDEKFIEAWKYIPFLSIASALSALSLFVGTIFMATKKTVYFLTTSIWGSLLCLALNVLLIPKLGLMGASVSLLLAHFLIYILRLAKTKNYVRILDLKKYYFQILIVLCLAIIVVYIENIIYKVSLIVIVLLTMILLNYDFINDLKLLIKNRKK